MTDKTKRIVLIAVCCLLCVAAAVGIAVRFGGNADISSGVVSDDPTQSGNPSVDIDCQDTIFGGFAPNSQAAEVLSKALGSRTVLSGSVSRGRNDPSQSLQMMERALLTPDELKSIPKGSFIVMKTGTHPMRTRLQLFLNWGITFGEPYVVPERANRAVAYANRVGLERNLPQLSEPEEMDESRGYAVSSRGGIAHTPAQERAVKRGKQMKTFGEEER